MIPNRRNFKGVRQSRDNDCIPACVATVLSLLTARKISSQYVEARLRIRSDGTFLTEAGIYFQQRGFRTHFELWKWQTVFPRKVFPRRARSRLKGKLLEISSTGGIYKDERFITYLNAGGKILLGGSMEKMIARIKNGVLVILGLDDGILRRAGRKREHAVVAFSPQKYNTVSPLYIYCPIVGDVTCYSPATVERAILSCLRGAALYIL